MRLDFPRGRVGDTVFVPGFGAGAVVKLQIAGLEDGAPAWRYLVQLRGGTRAWFAGTGLSFYRDRE